MFRIRRIYDFTAPQNQQASPRCKTFYGLSSPASLPTTSQAASRGLRFCCTRPNGA